MQTIGDLAARVKTLEPSDSLGKAAEAVRSSAGGAAPVLEGGVLVGLVTGSVLSAFVAGRSAAEIAEARVADLELERAMSLPDSLTPQAALACLNANGLERAPVVDGAGWIRGLVSTADLVSALCGRIRPALIGGMATPFGVYLTGGGVRGGVGDLALVSTGVFLGVAHVAAVALTVWLFGQGGPIARLPELAGWLQRLPVDPPLLSTYLFFLLFFRFSWVTGYHAAEHQVVHTLEAGDDLYPEVVRTKPRVHPRCGTNLVAAVLLMYAFWESRWFQAGPLEGPLFPMLFTALLWRRVGGWLQLHFTTRPARPWQIASGIAAAYQLLERYQKQRPGRVSVARRIWNIGVLQVTAGWLLVLGLLALLQQLTPLPEALRLY